MLFGDKISSVSLYYGLTQPPILNINKTLKALDFLGLYILLFKEVNIMDENKYRVIWKPKILDGTKVEYASERLSLEGALDFSKWALSQDVLYVRIEV